MLVPLDIFLGTFVSSLESSWGRLVSFAAVVFSRPHGNALPPPTSGASRDKTKQQLQRRLEERKAPFFAIVPGGGGYSLIWAI